MSCSPVLSPHPHSLPTQVLTCPSCFCPNAQPKGETPGFQLLPCGSGEVQSSWSPCLLVTRWPQTWHDTQSDSNGFWDSC